MAVNLKKGQRIDLQKGLKKVKVILGWTENQTDTGEDFDLDASVFMVDENEKCPAEVKEGNEEYSAENYFIFYGNLESPCGAVVHKGDDTTGGEGEEIDIDLEKMPKAISKLIFVVTIYDAKNRKQNFGMIDNAFIKLINAETGEEIARYDLAEDFSSETGVNFGELYKKGSVWKFRAVGQGYNSGLAGFLKRYGLTPDKGSEEL